MLALIVTQLAITPSTTLAATNLAAGKAITASSANSGFAATNANDSNLTTYWESNNNAFPQSIRVDLGSASSINQVVLKLPATWGARTQTLSVLGSTNDTSYTTIVASAAYVFDPTSANTVTINFTATSTRYVRVNITANSGWTAGQLAEFEIYGATAPTTLPGKLEAESYTTMSGIQTETTSDTGGGQNVGFTDTGDWLDYSVNVQSAGTYTVGFRVASPNTGSQLQLRNYAGTVLTTVTVPNTVGWQTWTTVNANVTLTAGTQTLRVYVSNTGFNINWLNFSTSATPTPTPTATPTTRSAFTQIEAESFNSQVGIQTETSSEAGLNVGFVDNGDYLVFNSINFGSGAISFDARVASAATGGNIEVRLDSLTGTLAGTCAIVGTGGWQTWITKTCSMSSISGVHNLYLKFTGGAGNLFNLNWFKFAATSPTPTPTPPPAGHDVVGKVFAGYQGWFNATGDGSPNGGWIHWSKNSSAPTANSNVNFELYPDTREYTTLYSTNLANFGNGTQAKLFSSYDQSTVNKHFEWMQTYNISGAALQRFGADLSDTPNNWKTNRDSVAVKVKNAAETYNRKFYVMYDITDMNASTWVAAVKHDWTTNIVNTMHLTTSSAYAKESGEPVVCIWGIGFTDRPGTAAEATDLINWFKNQGIYVIGGVPNYWRTGTNDSKTGFIDVYKSMDMVSPWSVGRFGGLAGVDNNNTNQWQPDYTFTQQNGMAYQPVLWPGSAWSNLQNGNAPRNENPRFHGDFMWRMAYDLKSGGISTGYVAMFDEYDEGTAIAKIAENSSMIPTNQYFLTLDADGVAVSSDFYLRLTGDINRLFNNQLPLTANHPTTHQ
ncbi:carbohydrate-binding protein [Paenibacillus psychroresistens]|uniref:Carbohydrate-binding protein n=2 Tax=Paenibacillus psychroresistens TaxID=1778678 RepID=A0A6B8RZF6_9BACL|nr:carbohydrate-binding protein [Paenibacillus psychroresistens]